MKCWTKLMYACKTLSRPKKSPAWFPTLSLKCHSNKNVLLKMCDWTCFFVAIFWKSNFSIIQISEQIPNIWAYSQSNLWPHLVLCQSNLGIFPTFCPITLLWTKDAAADKRGLDEKPLLGHSTLGLKRINLNNNRKTGLKWKKKRN